MTLELTPQLSETLLGHENGVGCVVAEGSKLFSGSLDATIKVWDLHDDVSVSASSGRCVSTLVGHEGGVSGVYSCEPLLFSLGLDKTIRLWDTRAKECVHKLATGRRKCNGIVVQGVNAYYQVGGAMHHLDLRVLRASLPGKDQRSNVFSTFSVHSTHRNGVHLALKEMSLFAPSAVDSSVSVYDVCDGAPRHASSLIGHSDYVRCLHLTSRGLLITAGNDKQIRFWDANPHTVHSQDASMSVSGVSVGGTRKGVASEKCVAMLGPTHGGHQKPVTALTKLRGRVFSASEDATIRVWQ